MTLKDTISARARDLGFDCCRFTTAAPPASAPRLQEWLDQQRHGEMAYLARNAHKRAEPQLVLPGARSVIALAAAYGDRPHAPSVATWDCESGCGVCSPGSRRFEAHWPPKGGTTNGRPDAGGQTPNAPADAGAVSVTTHRLSGAVARYARFTDYHDVLAEKLKTLATFVNQLGGPPTRSLWYVDTGPVLERDLAERAGLGFIGKHTNLISRTHGNWILLAEVLTTLDLEPDTPEKNRCGSCTRCLAACPTQAITAPFQLDARRCISYLTIELKGPIPVEFRPALGHRVFGCDDCLAVCPWNRFARLGRLMSEHERGDLSSPDLVEWLGLDEAGFRTRFGGTPLHRPGRRGLRRNVCVALGNTGDATALPALEKAAAEPDPLVAEHARWAVEQIRQRDRSLNR